ncbi:hypothetical protein TSAR_003558 [Trichomalopsis sarcophagae]|uniref:Uncharacterized protein n=1 Tax=Trichomalopsis sarcophagae TaxID=543379 RepID=A0A232EVB2_9HYME|nr:hypothetical protein TSAR_003558 [Trichomalopsis sarcophagae]
MDNILDLFEKERNITYSRAKNVVLVLGRVDSGKTIFTQFIAGSNDDLISQVIEHDTKTNAYPTNPVIPNMLEDVEENVAFYDFPGFGFKDGDTRNVALHYYIKSIIDSADSIKFVFTIGYHENENDFFWSLYFLVFRAGPLIQNLDEFKNSVALIVTKVDDKHIGAGENSVLVTDNVIIEKMARLLNLLKTILKRPDSYHQHLRHFVENFLEKDEHGHYKKIGIFRKPNTSGVFSSIALLQENRRQLKQVVHKNIIFSKYHKNDFNFTVLAAYDITRYHTTSGINTVKYDNFDYSQLFRELFNNVEKKLVYYLTSIRPEIEKYYYKEEEQFSDIHDLYNKTQSWNDVLSTQQEAISRCVDLRCAINGITQIIIDHGVSPKDEQFLSIKRHLKYLDFVNALTGDSIASRFSVWIKAFAAGIQAYLDDSKQWYNFFIYLHDALSSYDVQKNINAASLSNRVVFQNYFEKKTIIDTNFESILDSISATLLNEIKKNDTYVNIVNVKLDEVKLTFLNKILDKTLKNEVSYPCRKDNKLSLKGYNVKLSSIFDRNCSHSSVIEIFALNKVFIDTNLDRTGEKVQLSIIAPTWEVTHNSKIILDGKSGEDHNPKKTRDGHGFGLAGDDGSAGKPGGPSGSFFGIGQHYTEIKHLVITARGGKGGTGQHGGDGSLGKDADSVYTTYIPQNGNKAEWHNDNSCVEEPEQIYPELYSDRGITKGTCSIYSGNCTIGGHGGNGGTGGYGGINGNILLLNFRITEASKIEIDNALGEKGLDGNGGNGVRGGKQFLKITSYEYVEYSYGYPITRSYRYTIDENVERCSPGENGSAGKSLKHFEKPKPTVDIYLPTIINDYKSYSRENLKNGVMESFSRNFLDDLDKIDRYDAYGFVNELYSLEKQFYKLREELPMLPFYESLQKRVKDYAEMLYTNRELSEDQRKVLRYLLTAISTKICSINNIAANDFSINIGEHLDQAAKDINELKSFDDITRKNSYLSDYQKEMDGKIEEATNYIDSITESMKTVFIETDKNIKKLIQATHAKQNESMEEIRKNREQREELKKALALRIAFGVPKVLSTLLIFLGPAGVVASIAISGGLTVAEAMLLNKIDNPKVNKLSTLPDGVKYSMANMAELLRLKQQRIKTQIDDGLSILKDVEPGDELFDRKTKLRELSERVSKLKDDDYELAEEIYKEQLEFKKLRDAEDKKIEKDGKNMQTTLDKKATQKLKTIVRVQMLLETINTSINLYNDVKSNQGMIADVDKSLKESQDKIESLVKYEAKIYNTIIPIYRDLENSFRKTQSSLVVKSNAALDVSSWRVQSLLTDAKVQLEKLTADFVEQKDLIASIRKLQSGMDYIIRMYNYIQTYQEKKLFSNFIANVNLNQAKEILDDKILSDAVDDLKLIVKSNLVLEKYENAKDAFKQYVFPFAGVYFAKYDLPAYLEPKDTLSTAMSVTKIIEDLKVEIDNYDGGKSNYRTSFRKRHVGVKFGCPSDLIESFFVWKYNSYKQEIHRLLDGAEVILKSDIRQGFDRNAIKFSDIGIQFRFENKTIQNYFDFEIKDYEVSMVHLGLSYYRCDDKIYYTTSNNTQYISYIAKRNCSEKPQITNMQHDQIRMSRAVLSPYAFWKLKLTHNNRKNRKLNHYKNKVVDLMLEGIGDYVDLDLDVCKENLTKYYAFDDSKSEVEYFGFIEHELPYDSLIARSKRHHRVSRSVQVEDYMQDAEENSVPANSGCGSVKASYLSKVVSSISNSLIIFKNWLPTADLLHWFDNGEDKANHEIDSNFNINSCTGIPFSNLEPELPKISNRFTDDESATINSIFSNSSFCTNENLLLLDLIVRRKSGIKHKQGDFPSREFDAQYAQNLAYGSHSR